MIGSTIDVREHVESTMDVALEAARGGVAEGFVVIADEQSDGRGRLSRHWETPPGQALAMSVLLRPRPASPLQVARIPMILGLVVLDVLDPLLPGRCELKWPNDVLIDGLKVAGSLVEVGWVEIAGQAGADVIIGLGLNVLQPEAELPAGATSVEARAASGGKTAAVDSRTDLAIALLHALDDRYDALIAGEDPLQEWSDRLVTIGRAVEARIGLQLDGPSARSIRGIAVGVTEEGALRIQLADGTEEIVVAGDVTLAPR